MSVPNVCDSVNVDSCIAFSMICVTTMYPDHTTTGLLAYEALSALTVCFGWDTKCAAYKSSVNPPRTEPELPTSSTFTTCYYHH